MSVSIVVWALAIASAEAVVTGITPAQIDLAAPPATLTIAGDGFADLGFGRPVVNFDRGGTLLAQARATALTGTTSLTVPFPTTDTTLTPGVPGLSAGTVTVKVFNQTSVTFTLIGSVSLTVTDTRPCTSCVTAITPAIIDLATPPANFTMSGAGFLHTGSRRPVVNFARDGRLLGQARATAGTATSLTVPFPTSGTTLTPGVPGLSADAVQVAVFNEPAPGSYVLVGSVMLSVNDTRPCALCVTGIAPNALDLASPPASVTITGAGFVHTSSRRPVVNFARDGRLLGQARATAGTATSLTVPFPTSGTTLTPGVPGLSAGPVQVAVFNEPAAGSYVLVGSVTLSVNDSRPCALCVTAVAPNAFDLASPPASFAMTGAGFVHAGSRRPVVNFSRGGRLLAQARATAGTETSLTVPFPTIRTALTPGVPGLSAGPVQAAVFNEPAPDSYVLVGSVVLTVNDTRPCVACVTGITPSAVDLATAPASFTITGGGFADLGLGRPVVNFMRDGQLLGQARATAGTATSLTVPFPRPATSLTPGVPGLSAGAVQVVVFNQSGPTTFVQVGARTIDVTDVRLNGTWMFSGTLSVTVCVEPVAVFMTRGQFTSRHQAGTVSGSGTLSIQEADGTVLALQVGLTATSEGFTGTVVLTDSEGGRSAGAIRGSVDADVLDAFVTIHDDDGCEVLMPLTAIRSTGPFSIASGVSPAISDLTIPGRAAIGSDGIDFLVISCRQATLTSPTELTAIRVSRGGTVLGTTAIAQGRCGAGVAFDGTNYLVTYARAGQSLATSQIFGARVSRTGVVLGEVQISSGAPFGATNWNPDVAFDGTNYLVVWNKFEANHDIVGARVTPGGAVLPEFTVFQAAGEQVQPAIAFDGDNYLVVWRDTRSGSGPQPDTDIFGARVTPAGVVLDPLGIAISMAAGVQDAPRVAFDGENYLVVWVEVASVLPGPFDARAIRGARVTRDGARLDGHPAADAIAIATSPMPKGPPTVAFNGLHHVVAWQEGFSPSSPPAGLFANRVSRAGVPVGTFGILAGDGFFVAEPACGVCQTVAPALFSDDSETLLAWVEHTEAGGDARKSIVGVVFPQF